MVDAGSAINTFIEDNLLFLIMAFGILIGFIILWKKMRKVPANPDYLKIFKEKNIHDEMLNKRNKHDPVWLMKGEEVIGRIVAWDSQNYKYVPTKLEKDAGMWDNWEKNITTVVFKEGSRWKWFLGQKRILRFSAEDEGKFEDGKLVKHGVIRQKNKLVIPSDIGLTALGDEYITKDSYQHISRIVLGEYDKRLMEANVNLMAGHMSKISAETPEMAHELALKRLDIERIRAEKETKVSGLI